MILARELILKSSFSCRTMQEKDESAVKTLVESTFAFMGGKFWDWKYEQNPVLDHSLIAVAYEEGEVVGVNHWLPRVFKISGSTEVNAVLAADIAVSPNYRMKGVGRALMQFLRSTETVKTKKIALIYMFADPELRKRFHTPIGGYVPAPDSTVTYSKILNWKKVRQNAASFNQSVVLGKFGRKLTGLDVSVLVKMHHAPPLLIHLNESGASVTEEAGSERNPDITVRSDVATLNRIRDSRHKFWSFLRSVLTRKLRIRGNLVKSVCLYKNMWILNDLFAGKIT